MKFDLEKDRVLQAISNYYGVDKALCLQKTLASSTRHINNPVLLHKLHLRVTLCQADAILVRNVLALLPEAKQDFFQARYRDKVPFTFLAPKLYLSSKQLASWNNDICALLSDLLQARITEKVLSEDKLLIVQNRLDSILAAAANNGEAFDTSYLDELRARKAHIEHTLAKIVAYLADIQNSLELAVLTDWMRDNSLTYVELAYSHRVSEASARRYILNYKTKILNG